MTKLMHFAIAALVLFSAVCAVPAAIQPAHAQSIPTVSSYNSDPSAKIKGVGEDLLGLVATVVSIVSTLAIGVGIALAAASRLNTGLLAKAVGALIAINSLLWFVKLIVG